MRSNKCVLFISVAIACLLPCHMTFNFSKQQQQQQQINNNIINIWLLTLLVEILLSRQPKLNTTIFGGKFHYNECEN